MRAYRSPWWSRLLWSGWQIGVVAICLYADWDMARSGSKPAQPGLALFLGLLLAFLSTHFVIVVRDVSVGIYRTLRGDFRTKTTTALWLIAPIGLMLFTLGGCGIAARNEARDEYQSSSKAYKDCLLQNAASPQRCEGARLVMESDERKYNNLAAGVSGGQRASTVSILNR